MQSKADDIRDAAKQLLSVFDEQSQVAQRIITGGRSEADGVQSLAPSMVEALKAASKQFLSYSEHHLLKGATEKAGTNAQYALMCQRALKAHEDEAVTALKALVDCCEKLPVFSNPNNLISRSRLHAAKAIIAKAEGKS